MAQEKAMAVLLFHADRERSFDIWAMLRDAMNISIAAIKGVTELIAEKDFPQCGVPTFHCDLFINFQ